MDWTPGGMSQDVEDRRGSSGRGFGGGGLGIVGFIVLLIISLVTGRNFLGAFFAGGGESSVQTDRPTTGPTSERFAGEDRDVQLVSFVLDDAQKTWTQIFEEHNRQYRHAKLVLYRDLTSSGCGTAQESTGPFYCPGDEKVYIDLGFWRDLKRLGGDTGDFAQAYVIAHELGHHVQKLLGIESRMRRLSQQDPGEQNQLSVDLELQADCFAGVWAQHANQRNQVLEPGDVDEGLAAAEAIGDDRLQRNAGRRITPDSFTHGSSEQREHWLRAGLDSGDPNACDTFRATR
jgi:predicted metalloprotease